MLKAAPYLPVVGEHKLVGPWGGTFPWEQRYLIWKIHSTRGNILEIGTHFGYTAREFATAFPDRKVICVDVWAADYRGRGLTSTDDVCKAARNMSNVELRLMDSKDFVYDPADDISFIYIDGNHDWEAVAIDTNKALDYLQGRHGTIAWHDYSEGHQSMMYLDWLNDHGLVRRGLSNKWLYHVVGTTLVTYDC